MILRDQPNYLDQVIYKNWIIRFLDRHPNLGAKFASAFDKKSIKASETKIIADHFQKLGRLIQYPGGHVV